MNTGCSLAIAALLASRCCLSAAVANEPAALHQILETIRIQNDLPALAASVVHEGKIVASGAVGFRKAGSPHRVTAKDKWHIGSCTKSMTALVAGMMVEQGRWRWDMTVLEMFPALASEIRPEWRNATLLEFLSHYSGASDDDGFNPGLLARASDPPTEQRARFVREFLVAHGPATHPGTVWRYDNANYILVGHAIELALKQPWETIVRERLFKPLGMDSAGFGPPAASGKVDQPWGHIRGENEKLTSIPPVIAASSGISDPALGLEIWADNPAALSPAGTVHCSIGDLAKYAAEQLRGARTDGTLLRPTTFKKLHTRFKPEGEYACGWVVGYRDWAGGDALFHGGSNGTFMSAIWLAPERNFAVVVCANLGGTRCQAAVDSTVVTLVRAYLNHGEQR